MIKKKDKECNMMWYRYNICHCVVIYITITVTQSYYKENVIEDSRIGITNKLLTGCDTWT